jgi:hypothetical protein
MSTVFELHYSHIKVPVVGIDLELLCNVPLRVMVDSHLSPKEINDHTRDILVVELIK